MIGPVFAGFLAEHVGLGAPFFVGAGAAAVVALGLDPRRAGPLRAPRAPADPRDVAGRHGWSGSSSERSRS